MNWHIVIDADARKQLRRLPGDISEKIERAVDSLTLDPFSGDIVKLVGEENVWRRRVGNYRIKFEIYLSSKTVYVFDVKRRTSSTY